MPLCDTYFISSLPTEGQNIAAKIQVQAIIHNKVAEAFT